MANDTKEEFWGCTLSKDKKVFTWDPHADSEDDIEHKLQLTTACLGHKAKEGDRNLVEVTTEDDSGGKITCPVVSLRSGGTECIHLDLGFHNTTKFVLKEGNGPIALCGVHLQALPLDFDGDESSDDEDIPDLVEAKQGNLDNNNKSKKDISNKADKKVEDKKGNKKVEKAAEVAKQENKKTDKKVDKAEEAKKQVNQKQEDNKKEKNNKRPAVEPAKKEDVPTKKKKQLEQIKVEEDDDDDDDDEDDDEDDEDEEDDSDEEMETSILLDSEAVEDEAEDSEDDDEEEEGDDVESDEDDDDEDDDDDTDVDGDEEDSDEEEEAERPIPSKKLTNGHSTPAKNKQNKTPNKKETQQPQSNKKTPNKKETQETNKKDKKTPKSAGPKKTTDEIKAMLLKSPNIPKTFEKFANYMKNNMKVTDDKVQKDVWDYVQKNKK